MQSIEKMNKWNIFYLLKKESAWEMLELCNHWSKNSRSSGDNNDSTAHLFGLPGVHICLYRPVSFPFIFIADMPGCLMSARLDTQCILQVYSDNAYNSTEAFVLCSAQAEHRTETSSSHTPHSLGFQWTWSNEYEEEKDAITLTTGALSRKLFTVA